MNRMIYVRKADEPFWSRAEEIAAKRGIALSVLLAELVRGHVYNLSAEKSLQKTPDELLTEAEDALRQARVALTSEDAS